MISTEDVMDFLVRNRAQSLPLVDFANVLDQWIWVMKDNGAEILKIQRKWLSGDDPVKIEIALSMPSVFPFDTRTEMEESLAHISSRWPQLRGVCHQITGRWDRQFGKSK